MMGDDVLARAIVLICFPVALVGCAAESPTTSELVAPSFLTANVNGVTANVTGSIAGTAPNGDAQPMPKKTMADKVLTAIALERVTGLKPDPSRLTP